MLQEDGRRVPHGSGETSLLQDNVERAVPGDISSDGDAFLSPCRGRFDPNTNRLEPSSRGRDVAGIFWFAAAGPTRTELNPENLEFRVVAHSAMPTCASNIAEEI